MTASDSDLVKRAVALDDRESYGELVRRHQSAVRRFLRHLSGGNAALADDLAQDTFIQAHRSLARFRGGSSFTTWLLGIAHNHYRNSRRSRLRAAEEPQTDAEEETAGSPTRVSDLRHDLDAALLRLSSDEQTAVHLFYRQGLSHLEISAVLGWPLGTVKTHLARGKDKLRNLLAAWNPNP